MKSRVPPNEDIYILAGDGLSVRFVAPDFLTVTGVGAKRARENIENASELGSVIAVGPYFPGVEADLGGEPINICAALLHASGRMKIFVVPDSLDELFSQAIDADDAGPGVVY
jgi:hypothetical protein